MTLIEHGDVMTPAPQGEASLLLMQHQIARLGAVDRDAVLNFDPACRVIDATGCWVIPGLIDPHAHLIGGGGEEGFISRTPEVPLEALNRNGITTVVGLLGTDVVSRRLIDLLAKVRQLNEQGITAYLYTGGFTVPLPTLTHSVLDDLVLIPEVIGTGEIAIADERATEPTLEELARIVSQGVIGGRLTGKAGVTHFHTGPSNRRLSLLHGLLEGFDLPATAIYATHITRSEALLTDAIALGRRGAYVDMDTVEENIGECLERYITEGGLLEQLTMSSDAHTPGGSHDKLFGLLVACLRDHHFRLDQILPCFTSNTARVLKLPHKGQLAVGADADIIVLNKTTFTIEQVFARGQQVYERGASPAAVS